MVLGVESSTVYGSEWDMQGCPRVLSAILARSAKATAAILLAAAASSQMESADLPRPSKCPKTVAASITTGYFTQTLCIWLILSVFGSLSLYLAHAIAFWFTVFTWLMLSLCLAHYLCIWLMLSLFGSLSL